MDHDEIAELAFTTILICRERGITDPLRQAHAIAVAIKQAAADETPLACWEKQLVTEPFEQFTCSLPTGHDGPCIRSDERDPLWDHCTGCRAWAGEPCNCAGGDR